jgi:IS5 family transposase
VETDVHYPTDTNLLFDALRKMIRLCAQTSKEYGLPGWGKSTYNLCQVKRLFRHAQQVKASTSPDEKKREKRKKDRKKAYRKYLKQAEVLVQRGEETLLMLPKETEEMPLAVAVEIERFLNHAKRQIDQIERRVLLGETIPHCEKVFSLFETHTEWISKGKAGVPVELGLNTCILEDQYGFILHHRIMIGETDDAVAVPMIEETQERFPLLRRCSFDCGFYSPDNRINLRGLLGLSVLPSKGRTPSEEAAFEASDEFVAARRQHCAVESAINALEIHGLDRCPDQGLDGFRRYVALAILARNIQKLGALLQKKEVEAHKRRRKKAV